MTTPEVTRDAARLRRAALGLVAVALFVAAIWMTWSFLSGGFQGGARVTAYFSDPGIGQQLREGGDVKVRGVLVGRIIDIRLEGQDAVLELALETDLDLASDSIAEIRSKTIFGEKWVELIPPPRPAADALGDGDVIDDDHTIEPLELEQSLQLGHDLLSELPLGDLASLLEALADGFSGSEGAARTAIDEGLVALQAVNSRSDRLDLSLRQLADFSEWLDVNSGSLVSFMDSLDRANRALVGVAPEFEASLDSVPVFLDRLAAFQERTESDLGRLAEDGADIGELVAQRADRLVDIVRQLEAFTTVWNSGLSQPCSGEYEENLTCWQVYQMPGLDSRGLYGRTTPLNDEPGDPGLANSSSHRRALARALRAQLGPRLTSVLIDLAEARFFEATP
jgi:virulence factor Mce-like protein